MNIKKLAAIRRVAADEINATSIQPETVVKLCDEIIAATKRAEAAEAKLAAVPRQAIDALFRQQFGSYPVWFNETWTPIADWLGYKPARE